MAGNRSLEEVTLEICLEVEPADLLDDKRHPVERWSVGKSGAGLTVSALEVSLSARALWYSAQLLTS